MHVVRCFEDENIVHVDGSVDPVRDMETINLELIFADLETIERRAERARKNGKGGDKQFLAAAALCDRIKAHLEAGKPVRTMELDEDEQAAVKAMFLLTTKPVIYVANISENEIGQENPLVDKLYAAAKAEGAEALTICAKVEEEIAELSPEEKQAFIEELGIGESGLDKLVKACYKLLRPHQLPDGRPQGGPRLDDRARHESAAGRSQIHTISSAASSGGGCLLLRSMEHGSMQACKEKGSSAPKEKNMSSGRRHSWCSASRVKHYNYL